MEFGGNWKVSLTRWKVPREKARDDNRVKKFPYHNLNRYTISHQNQTRN